MANPLLQNIPPYVQMTGLMPTVASLDFCAAAASQRSAVPAGANAVTFNSGAEPEAAVVLMLTNANFWFAWFRNNYRTVS